MAQHALPQHQHPRRELHGLPADWGTSPEGESTVLSVHKISMGQLAFHQDAIWGHLFILSSDNNLLVVRKV